MSRVSLFILLTLTSLQAQSYEALLKKALEKSSNLAIAKTQEVQEQLQGKIATRLENPTLEVEIADFSAKRLLRENEVGTRVGLTQPLLLPWVKDDQERLSDHSIQLAKARYTATKATFIYHFNRLYLAYKEARKKEQLAQEALRISQKILSVAKERFSAGSIAKSELLQAKIETKEVESKIKELSLKRLKAKHELLRLVNLSIKDELSTEHQFRLKASTHTTQPLLAVAQKEQERADAKLALASHTIEYIELFSEIEAEPDQDIFRLGVAIPLPLFHNSSEEKQLAKIKIANQTVRLEAEKRALELELKQLQHEIATQKSLQLNYQALIAKQEQLLAMYQEGYAIAKVNLLKLNTLKKSLLQSKEQLLGSTLAIEQKIIKINYLQGVYHE